MCIRDRENKAAPPHPVSRVAHHVVTAKALVRHQRPEIFREGSAAHSRDGIGAAGECLGGALPRFRTLDSKQCGGEGPEQFCVAFAGSPDRTEMSGFEAVRKQLPVSFTHLTLPTILRV